MEPNVTIIILNWNGWKDTIECLESLYQIDYPNYDVIVLDNDSYDESLKKIGEYCNGKIEVNSEFFGYDHNNKPIEILEFSKEESETIKVNANEFSNLTSNKKLILIKNDRNYGFSEGNNIGIKFSLNNLDSDYILLLNNDTIVDKEFLIELIEANNNVEKVGIEGPSIYDYDKKNNLQSAGANIKWNKGTIEFQNVDKNCNPSQVDYIEGCSLFVKKEVFKDIGYLNSNYFCYWEETDFCVRASKANYNILCVPQAKIWHKGSKSVEKIGGFYSYYMTRNMFWFMKTHANRTQYIIFLFYFFTFRFWILSYIYLIVQRNKESYISFCKGIIDG
jgi:hypothetical protein